MKSIIIFFTLFVVLRIAAQVGINTTSPNAMLDVNGNLMVRTVPSATASTSYDFLVRDNSTFEVQKISGNLGASTVNTTMAKADTGSGVSLLTSTLFAGWQKVNFSSPAAINDGNNFNPGTDEYTVPSSGVYAVNFEFRYGSGILASVLSFTGTPRIGILRHTASGYDILDEKTFSGVNVVSLANIMISNSSLNSIYRLNAGERLSFEVNDGGLSLGLLSSSRATFSIYKISD